MPPIIPLDLQKLDRVRVQTIVAHHQAASGFIKRLVVGRALPNGEIHRDDAEFIGKLKDQISSLEQSRSWAQHKYGYIASYSGSVPKLSASLDRLYAEMGMQVMKI